MDGDIIHQFRGPGLGAEHLVREFGEHFCQSRDLYKTVIPSTVSLGGPGWRRVLLSRVREQYDEITHTHP